MPNIFALEDELVQIAEAFDQLEGQEETPEVLAAIEAYFGQLLADKDKKIDGYCRLITDFSAKAKARKAEADRIAALAKSDQSAADRLKARLKAFMELTGNTKLEGAVHKVAIQANGGVKPIVLAEGVEELDFTTVPEWAVVVTRSLNADAVRARLEEEELEWASLGERGTHVRIR